MNYLVCQLLPELDIKLLARCISMPSILEARTEFIKGIRQ